jgi:WD40 repeat protein
MTEPVSMTVTAERVCPFVGPRSFRLGEPLYGRDREIPKLLDLLIAERIVLMFSPSGAGKTSLIQAGLIPALREEGFHDLPIIRVKQPVRPDQEAAGREPGNRYLRSTLASLESRRPEAPEDPAVRLADLDALEPALGRWADALRPETDGRAPRLVLIFDQFEELLTTHPADIAGKTAFFDQLGTVLKDPGLWALFALREEYVAALEPYRNRIPRHLASRFRLDLLDAAAAGAAFEKPLESQGVSVAPGAVTRLVDDLRRVLVQRPDGTSEVVLGPHVEPVHLQIVGLRLWNRYGSDPGFTHLDETHLSGIEGSVDAALAGYYADMVREIGETTGAGERAIREWCERQLVTDQGLRGQVLREPGQTRGLPEPVIQALRDAFLVRAEERRGSTWYELAHDRLIEPVRTNNQEWREVNLHRSLLGVTDWDRAGRPESRLLRGPELKDVESWASAHDRLLTDAEREFLRSSRAQEWSKRRIQKYLGIVLGLLAILSLIAYLWQTAESERRKAEFERGKAETARDDAQRAERDAENQRQSAELARDAAQRAEREVENQRRLADRLAAELTIDRGISLCQQGRTDDGLLWLLRGLKDVREKKPRGHPTLDHLARLELAAWRAELTSLRWFQKAGGQVLAVAISPDGRSALTGSADRTARLWDLASGQPKGLPLIHDGSVPAVAFSRDGRTALTGSGDRTARLWDLATGKAKGPPLEHAGPVSAVAISPDGCTALTGSSDWTARLWDLTSGQPKGPPLKHDGMVFAVAFSPDGRSALTGSAEGTARRWDAATGQSQGPPLKLGLAVRAVAFGPDGRTALTGSTEGTARLWDLVSGQPKEPPLKHDVRVNAVAISPDGRSALTGGYDNTARVWDLATGQPKGPPLKYESLVWAMAISPDGHSALTGSHDKTARLWDVAIGQQKGPTLKHEGSVRAVAISPDGRSVLTGSDDYTARLWDLTSGQPKGPPLKHDGMVFAVAFSPDGRSALTGSLDGRPARLWDLASGQRKASPLEYEGPVNAVAISPDGRSALTGNEDRTARLWDLASGQPKGPALNHDGPVTAVAISPDGRSALTGSWDHTARLWEVTSGRPHGMSLKHDGPVFSVAFSPNGRTALIGGGDKTARLWDVQTQKPIGLPLDHRGTVTGTAYSPDGSMVLTSSGDRTAQLWLAATQRPIGAPFTHASSVSAVAFSPDGRWIATGSSDKTAQLWRVPTAIDDSVTLERLALWVRVVTRKELGESGLIRTLDLDEWQEDRQQLDRLGGPPDRPALPNTAVPQTH